LSLLSQQDIDHALSAAPLAGPVDRRRIIGMAIVRRIANKNNATDRTSRNAVFTETHATVHGSIFSAESWGLSDSNLAWSPTSAAGVQ
jgi:hypothetical protein